MFSTVAETWVLPTGQMLPPKRSVEEQDQGHSQSNGFYRTPLFENLMCMNLYRHMPFWWKRPLLIGGYMATPLNFTSPPLTRNPFYPLPPFPSFSFFLLCSLSSFPTFIFPPQHLTWLRSSMNVDSATDTVSLLCILVWIESIRPNLAFSAGTKLPIWAKNTIRPFYMEGVRSMHYQN